jgi:hypothetical protein
MKDHLPSASGNLRDLRPRARAEEVVVTEFESEILVYDLLRHRAHDLNPTAALIWQHCDGRTTVWELAALRLDAGQAPLGEAVVWLSLRQLADAQLLDGATPLPADAPRYSRLQLLRAGLVSSAVVLPVVATILAPTVAHAQSCGGLGDPCCPGGICNCIACTCDPITNTCVDPL